MQLTRREYLLSAAAAVPLVACAPDLQRRRRPPKVSPLRLRPPRLSNPKIVDLDDVRDPSVGGVSLKLYGEQQDWIIKLPKGRPLPCGLVIDGRNEARNIVIIGGSIQPAQISDVSTTTFLNGDGFSVYCERGFSGASGGTFRIQTGEHGVFTEDLDWNATATELAAAIDGALGQGAVTAVVPASQTPGGPWKFVPADARLGRVTLDLTKLEGNVSYLDGINFYQPASTGLAVKDFLGTVHLEGLEITGPFCDEGVDVQTPYANSRVQMSSCHVEVPFFYYNDDWQHPDAMQCYLGPASLQIERTDLITYGTQALLGQPRMTDHPLPLELLRDWWFDSVLFQARTNADHPTSTPGTTCYQEDDWPQLNDNDANWHWVMSNCFASRLDASNQEVEDGVYLLWWNHYPLPPPRGLTLKQTPPQGFFASPAGGLSGASYVSPGYGGPPVPLGTARLRGNTKLT